jgi:hypothetical protein
MAYLVYSSGARAQGVFIYLAITFNLVVLVAGITGWIAARYGRARLAVMYGALPIICLAGISAIGLFGSIAKGRVIEFGIRMLLIYTPLLVALAISCGIGLAVFRGSCKSKLTK